MTWKKTFIPAIVRGVDARCRTEGGFGNGGVAANASHRPSSKLIESAARQEPARLEALITLATGDGLWPPYWIAPVFRTFQQANPRIS